MNFKFFSNLNKKTSPSSSKANNAETTNKKDNEWEFLQQHFKNVLADEMNIQLANFDKLYKQASNMIIHGRGSELYESVRKIVSNHLKNQTVRELQTIKEMPNGNSGALLIAIDKEWYKFFGIMDHFRSILLYSERAIERSIGTETILAFGWRIFRLEVLENRWIKERLPMKVQLDPSQTRQIKLHQNEDLDFSCPVKGTYLDSDIMVEVMSFLENFQIGLNLALVTRQLATISDYILNKRKHILQPLMICAATGNNEDEKNGNGQPFAIKLQKVNTATKSREKRRMSRVLEGWNALLDEDSRIELPKIKPPQWIIGVEFLYLTDGLDNDILAFLYSLRTQLKNCSLYLNLSLIWTRLHENNIFWPFLNLFNQCCFSLTHTDIPILNCSGQFVNENAQFVAIQWPIWALFNNIFFSHCCELNIPIGFLSLSTPQNELEIAKWLQHSSTEKRPRKLKFYTENHQQQNWFLTYRRAITAMIEAIKHNFMNSHGKRQFFVEFGRDGLNYQNWGEWQNAIGEQLIINQFNIKRLSLEDREKKFEDFYAHLSEESIQQPKVLISSYKWLKKSVTPGTPVAVRRSMNNPPTPVVKRK